MKRLLLSSCVKRCAFVLFASVVTTCAMAQKTEADIKARLVNQPLFLRGQWNTDKLEFDESGHFLGKAGRVSFTLSGVKIEFVKMNAKGLDLEGQRVGLEFIKDVPKRIDLLVGPADRASPEKVTIKIKAPTDGDCTTALNAIFGDSIVDLAPAMPECWLQFARDHLLPPVASTDGATPPSSGTTKLPEAGVPRKIGGGVSSPRLLKSVEPEFSQSARSLRYSGIVLVSMVVGEDGLPRQLRVLRPSGLGLDEQAIVAVSKYTFSPALEGGKPVPVMVNVEVNFQIY